MIKKIFGYSCAKTSIAIENLFLKSFLKDLKILEEIKGKITKKDLKNYNLRFALVKERIQVIDNSNTINYALIDLVDKKITSIDFWKLYIKNYQGNIKLAETRIHDLKYINENLMEYEKKGDVDEASIAFLIDVVALKTNFPFLGTAVVTSQLLSKQIKRNLIDINKQEKRIAWAKNKLEKAKETLKKLEDNKNE